MDIKKVFRMPNPVKIMGRTSSITNSFVNGIIPIIMPTEKEILKVLDVLEMNEHTVRCAYCGDPFTEWDHFHPIVRNKKATGYISEIQNLVPACGKCNQSKGNYYWKEWILGPARLSPKTRNVENLDKLIVCLEKYEEWSNPQVIDFESIVGNEDWEQHWENCKKIHDIMRESQILSDKIKITIAQKISPTTTIPTTTDNTKIAKVNRDKPTPKKIGLIVQTKLRELLVGNNINMVEIESMKTQQYSKKTFNINYPLLKEVDLSISLSEQMKDHNGINRYYKLPVMIYGKKYLMCSQWYEWNRLQLMNWITLNGESVSTSK